MPLNLKQQRFAEEYLVDLNATQAAIRAGYSEKTAHSQGPRLLENVEVAAAISAGMNERSEKTGITAEWVLEQAAKVYREAINDDDRKNALRALEMCGKHVAVGAFKEGAANVSLTIAPSLAHFYGQSQEGNG